MQITNPSNERPIVFQSWAKGLFEPYRYKVIFGGRGSGKSFAVADTLLVAGMQKVCRILCGREFQNSIADSVHCLLRERIEALGMDEFYTVQRDVITGANGTTFIFKGVRHNIQSIKSISGVTHLWLEEAQSVSRASWDVLVPTIREPDSEIFCTFNPESTDDTIYKEFVAKDPGPAAYVCKVNWHNNPFFPAVLDEERRRLHARDPDLYAHIWEGECITRTDAQIFANKWAVREFEAGATGWDGPYIGLDFGFARDPTAAVRCWVHGDCLYIDYEGGRTGLELDQTTAYLSDRIPDIAKYVIRADSARPESISYLARHGLPKIRSVDKWPGSVEDGIQALRAFQEIVVHPRCTEVQKEMRLYSYKVDRLSGDILPTIVDAYNHFLDATRYAVAPLIKSRHSETNILIDVDSTYQSYWST